MPEDRPNSSRDAASVIDAVRAVVLTKPAGNPKAAARSAGGSARRFVEDGGGGARGPCTAARNASSWPLSAAARSASFSAATARRRFFSFFRSFFRRFRFFSSLRSRLRFFSFLRFRLRLRSSLLEVLELELELELLLLLEDAIRGAKPVTAAVHDERAGQQCVQCSGAQLALASRAQCARGWCDRCGARGPLRVSYGCNRLERGAGRNRELAACKTLATTIGRSCAIYSTIAACDTFLDSRSRRNSFSIAVAREPRHGRHKL